MKLAISVCLIVSLTACAGSSYRPLVDTVGQDMSRYESDLKACQEFSDQVAGAGNQAVVGAVIGALLSVGVAAIGGSGYSKGRSAGAGALLGGATGAGSGETDQRDVIRRCMSGRGYRVLQ